MEEEENAKEAVRIAQKKLDDLHKKNKQELMQDIANKAEE